MILTPLQINELIELVKNLHWVFVNETIGSKYIPEDVFTTLKKYGVKKSKVISTPEYAFHYGILSMALGDKRAKSMTFAGLKKFIKSKMWIPLTKWEQYGVALIENRLVDGITGLGNKIASDMKTILIEKDLVQRKEFENIIKGKAQSVFTTREGVKQLVSELGHKTGDWARDFGRISDFVLHEAYDNGRAYGMLRHADGDATKVMVYKNVYNLACDSCKRLYLEYKRGTRTFEPRVFPLSELLANGTNIGRKQADWKPVVGATHPWCRCDLEYVPPDTKWNAKRNMFVDELNDNAKRLNISKFIKITVED